MAKKKPGEKNRKGIPCLIPVKLSTDGRALRGVITRLSEKGAFISLETSFVGANEIVAFFKRPKDGVYIGVPGQVTEISHDGGLWRGRPAVQIRFATTLNLAPTAESWPASKDPPPPREPALPTDDIPEDRGEGPTRTPAQRVLSDVPVTFILAGRKYEGIACNFSEGGLYIVAENYPRVDAVVHVLFPLHAPDGDQRDVEINGVVRWFQEDRPELDLPSGFGVQIQSFEVAADEDLYDRFVNHLTEAGLSADPDSLY